uniref:Alpha/beta hydrolase fold-3 domain-containing protein n=1 Tax=Pyrodinium bahamense TaxID=73915 RepID=A0A7S0ASV7_9DINO
MAQGVWLKSHVRPLPWLRMATPASKAKQPVDNILVCISKLLASAGCWENAMDKSIAPGVSLSPLPPTATGFPAWRRCPTKARSAGDQDRGHAHWAVPEGADNTTARVLYFHGGGLEDHSPQDRHCKAATSRLAAVSGMPVLAIDYRLVPEFRHPAQLQDALQAFHWICGHGPEGPGTAPAVFLSGESSGGHLALALALRLRGEGFPTAAALAGVSVVSPVTDLSCSGESYRTRRWRPGGGNRCDPLFRSPDVAAESMLQIYMLLGKPGRPGSFKATDPSISPLHADLHGLPPTQIHVGDAEVLLSDSVEFGKKAAASGSPVEVIVWPRMWHSFTLYSEGCGGAGAEPLQEALDALRQQGAFMRRLAAQRCTGGGAPRDGRPSPA